MRILSLILFFPLFLSAADLRPWYGRDLQPHPYIAWNPLLYDHVATDHGSVHRREIAHFVTLGLEGSYSQWGGELEVVLADTLDRNFGFDHAAVTGRYQWFSDDIGDLYSFVTGITLIQAVTESVNDLSSFHHAKFEGEIHAALGRQCILEQYWVSRWWGVIALGIGDRGSPWIRGDVGFERNFWDQFYWRVFAKSLCGLGNHGLDLDQNFHGYGNIKHRSIDLGARITYWTDCAVEISGEYAYRVYAKNFPKQAHQFLLQIMYPMAL